MFLDQSHIKNTSIASKNMEVMQAFILLKEKGVERLWSTYPDYAAFILEHKELSFKEFKDVVRNL